MYIPELYITRGYLDDLLLPKVPYLQDDNECNWLSHSILHWKTFIRVVTTWHLDRPPKWFSSCDLEAMCILILFCNYMEHKQSPWASALASLEGKTSSNLLVTSFSEDSTFRSASDDICKARKNLLLLRDTSHSTSASHQSSDPSKVTILIIIVEMLS